MDPDTERQIGETMAEVEAGGFVTHALPSFEGVLIF